MAVVGVLVLGFVSFTSIPLTLMPDFSLPRMTVRTEFPDASPQEVESLITRPLEENLSILNGVTGITSVSRAEMSDIVLEFAWGTNLDTASLEIREKIHQVRLPEDSKSPVILKFNPNSAPVLQIVAISEGLDFTALRELADRELRRELLQLPGVAMVTVSGGDSEEVEVLLNEGQCSRFGISAGSVIATLGAQNVNLVGGEVMDGGIKYVVRTLNEIKTPESIGETVLMQGQGGAVIRVADVASVGRRKAERRQATFLNGIECVEIAVYRQGDSNIVETARAVKKRLPALNRLLDRLGYRGERAIKLQVVTDSSTFVERSLKEVVDTGVMGGLIAVIILFLFLARVIPTVAAAVTIPVSIVASFNLMFFGNVSFNMMSLGGLALGVGMLVDNSIVVLENIHRHRTLGLPPAQAAAKGAEEVTGAITASTLTNIAVFFPVVFVHGMAGQVFGDLALTVTYSLMASLLLSVTLIPCVVTVLDRGLPGEIRGYGIARGLFSGLWKVTLGGAAKLFSSAAETLQEKYSVLARGMISRPLFTLFCTALVVGTTLFLSRGLGSSLMPEVEQLEFMVRVRTSEGTPLPATRDRVNEIASTLKKALGSELESTLASVGYSSWGSDMDRLDGENIGQVNVRLANAGGSGAMARASAALGENPGAETEIKAPAIIELAEPIEVRVFGPDLTMLSRIATGIERRIASQPWADGVRSSMIKGAPELTISVDRDAAAHYGIPVENLLTEIRRKIRGETATDFTEGEGKIEVVVRSSARNNGIDGLRSLTFPWKGNSIPIASVAAIIETPGPGQISRADGSRMVRIISGIAGNSEDGASRQVPLSVAIADVKGIIANTRMPAGYYAVLEGMGDEMAATVDSMTLALALAILMVYIVMASQFESILDPLIIMVTVPFSLAGAALALKLTGQTMNLVVAIGAVMLVGIAVNNGIVLIDAANRLRREEGMTPAMAAAEAARRRLRPILMTTLTTITGLLPLALAGGEGAELRAPMAITVMGGLAMSTLLTLVAIPVLHAMVTSFVGKYFPGMANSLSDEDDLFDEIRNGDPLNSDPVSNGIQSNGTQSSGIQSNGAQSNGTQSSGIQSGGTLTGAGAQPGDGRSGNGPLHCSPGGLDGSGELSDNADMLGVKA
jgi:HAE1 family hydrophobic/amphiphilic exporter-1